MFRHIYALCGLLAAALFMLPAYGQPAGDVVLYEGARLIPGDGRAAINDAAFLVENGIITRVGVTGGLAAAGGV